MALTDKEIQTVQQIITIIKRNKISVDGLNSLLQALEDRVESSEEMSTWSQEEWIKFLTPIVLEILRRNKNAIPLKQHTHESDDQGGDAFARKGGLLI